VSNILHKELVRENPSIDSSVDFAVLTLKSREKSTTFQLLFLKRNLNLLSDFKGPVLAHNFATPISGGK
jgi:phage terminase large subunit-like protein